MTTLEKIMILAREAEVSARLERLVAGFGWQAVPVATAADAAARLPRISPVAVIIDPEADREGAGSLIRNIRASAAPMDIWILTSLENRPHAMARYKHRATEFVFLPILPDALEFSLERLKEKLRLKARIKILEKGIDPHSRDQTLRLIETERFIVVKQIVDKISHFIAQIADDVEGGVRYFHETPYFVAIHNKNLEIVATDPSYVKHFGNHIGGRSWEVYAGNARTRDGCPVGRTLHTGNVGRVKVVAVYQSGTRVPVIVHTAPIFNNDGEVELVLEVAAGSREIKSLREELQNTQQRYQQLFDAVPSYIAVLDRKMRITAVNRRFRDDFGDRAGIFFQDIFKPATRPAVRAPIAKTLADGGMHQQETELIAENGKRIKSLVWTSPIKTRAGKVIQILVIFADITQLRRLQDNLSSLGLMLGSISHGIKGVLTGLDAGLYLIKSGFYQDKPAQVEEGLEVAKLMVERIRKVILDILYYAKQRELNWERVEAVAFARDVAAVVRPRIKGGDIEFVENFDPECGFFEVDKSIFRSALINILENAVEACVEDSHHPVHQIDFNVRPQGDDIVFEIIDNGVGMDKEGMEKIFARFYSSKGHRGTGLGLFITDKVVRQHGGEICVDSAPGRGSHFTVKMPVILPESVKSS